MKKRNVKEKIVKKTKKLKANLEHYSSLAEEAFERFKKEDMKKLLKIFKKYRY